MTLSHSFVFNNKNQCYSPRAHIASPAACSWASLASKAERQKRKIRKAKPVTGYGQGQVIGVHRPVSKWHSDPQRAGLLIVSATPWHQLERASPVLCESRLASNPRWSWLKALEGINATESVSWALPPSLCSTMGRLLWELLRGIEQPATSGLSYLGLLLLGRDTMAMATLIKESM